MNIDSTSVVDNFHEHSLRDQDSFFLFLRNSFKSNYITLEAYIRCKIEMAAN